ncbi:MAG: class I SAM-dependent methyltransferase [Acidobacteria bacterium]|nr:class I SAM-dependent methyltransferase [Acidobacteriota bacterium]
MPITLSSVRRMVSTWLAALLVLSTGSLLAEDTKPAPDIPALAARHQAAMTAGDWAAAAKVGEELVNAVAPLHFDTAYAVAAAFCQMGQTELAYAWLEEAKGAGYWDVWTMRQDERFAAIRDQERFKIIVRQMRARSYIQMLERPERESFQKPDQVMAALALKPGERVADVGAGSGYFTTRVAKVVGPDATVWAVDISDEMLSYLGDRIKWEKIANIKLHKAQPTDPLLPPGGFDTILMVDTLHYVKDKAAYAQKLRAALAPGGRVVIIDYTPKTMEERPWGPPPEQQFSRQELDAAMAAAGLAPVRVHEFLTEQYFVEYVANP